MLIWTKVTDASLPSLCSMVHLVQLHIFSCGLTGEGQVMRMIQPNLIWQPTKARLLLSLPKLSCLPRGDFLCEAVDWVEWLESDEGTKEVEVQLGVQEFHYSEEYHFHTVTQVKAIKTANTSCQVEQVARICPKISKVRQATLSNVGMIEKHPGSCLARSSLDSSSRLLISQTYAICRSAEETFIQTNSLICWNKSVAELIDCKARLY